jgi:hypothetical protein
MVEALLIQILALIFVALIYLGIVCVIRIFRPKELNYVTKLVLRETIIQRWLINLLFLVGVWTLFNLFFYTAYPELIDDQGSGARIRALSMWVSFFSTHIINNFIVNLIKRASATVIPDKQNT